MTENQPIWTGRPRPRGDWVPTGTVRDQRDRAGKLLAVSRQRQRARSALATVGKQGRYRVIRLGKGTTWLRRPAA